MLEIEAAATAAAPIGLGHLFEDITGVGLEQRPGLSRHPQGFFQMAGIVIGDRYPSGLRSWSRGRNSHLIHQELGDIQGPGRQVSNPLPVLPGRRPAS